MHGRWLDWKEEEPLHKLKISGIDIVVIKVVTPFVFNDIVNAACLPTQPIQPGSECYPSGWGTTLPWNFQGKVQYYKTVLQTTCLT